MKYKVKNKLWIWGGGDKGSWHFLTIPPEIAAKIQKKYTGLTKGWGSLPVVANLKSEMGDKAILETSIFPNRKEGTYILPVKKATRKELGAQDGDILEVSLQIKTLNHK